MESRLNRSSHSFPSGFSVCGGGAFHERSLKMLYMKCTLIASQEKSNDVSLQGGFQMRIPSKIPCCFSFITRIEANWAMK